MSDIKVDDVSKDDESNQNEEANTMPSAEQEDHERAYFDSADWALGKGGHAQKPKGPLEALRPKLQPTPQQQVRSRRPVYASSETEDGDNAASEAVNDNNDGTDGSDQ
ncbi:uncharacterized protein LOC141817757 isoform X4 [Curcuma longa]|uniref:uncharacterized protein LOC141817757 isoform X4 n=1 Tax=Curcuma longa TaxID=136217 RepID=UPI003D9DF778